MSYEIIKYNARIWIKASNRLLAGYAANELRTYVFPLYSPSGALVLQESPPDHPHHQGICVGLEVDGHDMWNAGSFGRARHRQELQCKLSEIAPVVRDEGVQIAHPVYWTSADGDELLLEDRSVTFRAMAEFTHIQWRSTFHHPQKVTNLGQTKESGIGIRVPPHWETIFGGRIRNQQGSEGEAATFNQMSPWISIQGRVAGDQFAGIVLAPTAESEPCPWFTRDYGLNVYNPARHRQIHLDPGETLTWSVHVLAYDGVRSALEIDQWLADLN